jgi:hypothetical protein
VGFGFGFGFGGDLSGQHETEGVPCGTGMAKAIARPAADGLHPQDPTALHARDPVEVVVAPTAMGYMRARISIHSNVAWSALP